MIVGLRELITGRNIAEQAYEEREARTWPDVAPYVQGMEDFVKNKRRENFRKSAANFPRPEEVTRLRVCPTADGGFTVGLMGIDGRRCTFWVYCGNLPERKPDIDGASQCYNTSEITFPVDGITDY